MPYNGSGTFNRAESDYIFDTVIDETAVNNEMDDIATGLTTALTKDGQTTVTANIPMNSKKFTGLTVGSARTDSVSLGQVQDKTMHYGGTAGGTVDVITFSVAPAITALVAGQEFLVLASGANTGAMTANPNGIGATAIKKTGGNALVAGDVPGAGFGMKLAYDGTDFELLNPGGAVSASETVEGVVELATQAEVNTGTDTARSLTPATLKSHLTTPNPIGAATPNTGEFSSLQLPAGAIIVEFSTDGTMAGNSAVHVPTESAVVTYVAAQHTGLINLVADTYDVSTATGTQNITGAGFQPDFVEIQFAVQGGAVQSSNGWHDGTDDFSIYVDASGDALADNTHAIKYVSGANIAEADCTITADGVDLSWTKTASPTGTINMQFKFVKY